MATITGTQPYWLKGGDAIEIPINGTLTGFGTVGMPGSITISGVISGTLNPTTGLMNSGTASSAVPLTASGCLRGTMIAVQATGNLSMGDADNIYYQVTLGWTDTIPNTNSIPIVISNERPEATIKMWPYAGTQLGIV